MGELAKSDKERSSPCPSICIMMSTYNGGKYIEEQIDTILRQEGCRVNLIIRDDGSDEETKVILRDIGRKYHDIKIYYGRNIGYRKSFLKLMCKSPEADYYGFSDQDDIWEPNKCIRAIEMIRQRKSSTYKLYASSMQLVDIDGNGIGFNDISISPNTIQSYFMRHRIGGCTIVFTKSIRDVAVEQLKRGLPNKWVDHDFYVVSLAYAIGEVMRDEMAFIKHRRLESSVTGGGQGILKRIKVEKFLLFERRNLHYDMARWILESNLPMNSEVKDTLINIVSYKNSVTNRTRLIFDRSMTCGIRVCDIESRAKMLLGNF